jgi:hypothetical protein
MQPNTTYEHLITPHLQRFPEDRRFVALLLQNQEFSPQDRSYESWLQYNVNSLERGEDFITTIEKQLGSVRGFNILDVGAKSGGASIAFYRRGCSVTAVEIDSTRLHWLRRRIEDHDASIHILATPIEELSFAEHYDLIYCSDVLEHVSNWRLFLRRLLAIDHDRIYLSWPHKYSPFEIVSDSHYALFGATFLTGRLRFLQDYYLRIMNIDRDAWVMAAPRLLSVKNCILKASNVHKVEHFVPLSFQKIENPERINHRPSRVVLAIMKKAGVPDSCLVRLACSVRKTHQIVISKVAPIGDPQK